MSVSSLSKPTTKLLGLPLITFILKLTRLLLTGAISYSYIKPWTNLNEKKMQVLMTTIIKTEPQFTFQHSISQEL